MAYGGEGNIYDIFDLFFFYFYLVCEEKMYKSYINL